MTRFRLTNPQREQLYKDESHNALAAGRGEHPICKLCDRPILPGRKWHANHEAHKPRWLGGAIDGLSHEKCNLLHGQRHDTPLFAKNERQRKSFLDLRRSRKPLPGGRDDRLKKKISDEVVLR